MKILKKWWGWLFLSAIWILAAILNLKDGRNGFTVGFDFFAAVLLMGLGFCQYICEKRDKTGTLKYIYAGVIGMMLLYLFIVLLCK